MAAIDYERVVLGLKTYIRSRSSHGQRDLLAELTDLEVKHQVPEGQEGYSDLPARRLHPSQPSERVTASAAAR